MKEPHFFNTERAYVHRASAKDYEELFRGATAEHIAVGEASTGYLSSQVALPAILAYAGSPRFLVCIRNPIDMVVSWHGQLLRMGVENRRDVEVAWQLQDERRNGRRIPLLCKDAAVLQYRFICSLGQQLKRVFELVSSDRVCVVVLDDIMQAPLREYHRILNFLGVEDDGRRLFPVHNPSTSIPVPLAFMINVASKFKLCLKINRRFGLIRWLEVCLRKRTSRPELSPEFLDELRESFRGEIEQLGKLLDRDFSPWLDGQTVAVLSNSNGAMSAAEAIVSDSGPGCDR